MRRNVVLQRERLHHWIEDIKIGKVLICENHVPIVAVSEEPRVPMSQARKLPGRASGDRLLSPGPSEAPGDRSDMAPTGNVRPSRRKHEQRAGAC